MNNMIPKAAIWMVIALVLFTVFRQFDNRQARGPEVPYSQFMEEARQGRIKSAQVEGRVEAVDVTRHIGDALAEGAQRKA